MDELFVICWIGLAGAMCTYLRFFPYIKRNYDYGVLIFLLTFNLISVSSYRVESVLKVAHERLYTIIVGCVICLLMSLLIFPNWSGEDLHNATVSKLEGLAKSMEGVYKRVVHYNTITSFVNKASHWNFVKICRMVWLLLVKFTISSQNISNVNNNVLFCSLCKWIL